MKSPRPFADILYCIIFALFTLAMIPIAVLLLAAFSLVDLVARSLSKPARKNQ